MLSLLQGSRTAPKGQEHLYRKAATFLNQRAYGKSAGVGDPFALMAIPEQWMDRWLEADEIEAGLAKIERDKARREG